MNEEKITIKIADQTGLRINESDIPTGKIVVNGVEVIDTESWNKAISTFTELEYQLEQKDKEIERLQNIINELEKKLLELRLTDVDGKTIVYRLLDKLKELKDGDKE